MKLVYVWYHDSVFVPDSLYYPFLSNFRFNSKYRSCHVFYYINNTDNLRIPENEYNQDFIDFKTVFPEDMATLTVLPNKAQKIDFMKLSILFKGHRILNTKSDILLLDFDCHIKTIGKMIYNVEPFYCKKTKYLYVGGQNDEQDSYIENYATRIDEVGSRRLYDIFTRLDFHPGKSKTNSYVYMIYVSMIIEYFKVYHNYIFPTLCENVYLESSVDMSYSRGSTWKIDISNLDDDSLWIIKYSKPFNKAIKDEIQDCIHNKNFSVFYTIVLKELNLPFDKDIFWLNDKQRNGTLKEYVHENIKDSSGNTFISIIDRAINFQKSYIKYQI
ncbi:hypothetical protein FPV217 [Fowlpox virus]|uniref:Uncharacterized protein n=2 Tax=Fowlpox virus TaxID=10261 RepID=Q9J518_FOWPN|nr:hypothetical protein FPV217 [Fowlpox virus]UNS14455.1 ALPV-291 [Albatrosspox virus]CAE52755.1 hypothetical protein [Fowlpox virus isolate HP-438/Munich]AAF44561.1 ORF FPV217 hypothetical protein [Fowlpox virus]ART91650.1 hypothetical protein [Fowlpox virus]AXY04659.1 hypothetical protein [Fowlpox virus]